jgi:hypothetical protein
MNALNRGSLVTSTQKKMENVMEKIGVSSIVLCSYTNGPSFPVQNRFTNASIY